MLLDPAWPERRSERRGAARKKTASRALLLRYQGLLFALPALLALAALIGYPLVDTAVLSFTTDQGHFAGWSNYATILDDDTTALATYNSIIYVVGSIVFQLVLGTIAGILLNQRFIGRGPLRTILLIPWVVPGIVAATTWAWMFHIEFGIINYALQRAHVITDPVGWLINPELVLPSVIAVNVWKMFPFVGIMVLAGLQAIPDALYEAARVDGATFLHEVRYIMLPQLRPVLLSVGLLLVIWGMNGITIIYAMTGGGPANQSLILPIQIFKEAFEAFQFNPAAALSLVLFLVLFVVIMIYTLVFQSAKDGSGA
jgi:multiple sugar transport system permease protein